MGGGRGSREVEWSRMGCAQEGEYKDLLLKVWCLMELFPRAVFETETGTKTPM